MTLHEVIAAIVLMLALWKNGTEFELYK